jgi:phosphoribosyl 1,2-cyclic phosphate phosphodiesterase
MKATLLGTSGAWPVPEPGCVCPQCDEARGDARFRRTRCCLRIETGEEVVLVDPGPDLLHQLEREGMGPYADRVLITHTHGDHCLGLSDLVHVMHERTTPLPVHAAAYHRRRLADVFPSVASTDSTRIRYEVWKPGTRLELSGVTLEGFETGHGSDFPTTAVMLEVEAEEGAVRRIAYATDMGELPEASREPLTGIDLLVGDGSYLGEPGKGHPGTDAVIALAEELRIARVAFTHIGHVQVSDADLRRRLGPEVGVAYDGQDLLALLADA